MITFNDNEKVHIERIINEIKFNLEQIDTAIRYNFTPLVKFHRARYLDLTTELTKFLEPI